MINSSKIEKSFLHNRCKDMNPAANMATAVRSPLTASGEWSTLQMLTPRIDPYTHFSLFSSAISNSTKNRYPDVLALEETRVPVDDHEGYINANFVSYRESDKIIVTQEPISETYQDFWKMVNTQNVRYIICLNDSAAYWTDHLSAETTESSIMTEIISLGTSITCRELDVGEEKIIHISFRGWPDNKVPVGDSVRDLVNLSRWAATVEDQIVVHCSAGIGRTGTFLAMIFKQLYPTISVIEIVNDMRRQRPGMVQTLTQYRFLKGLFV